MADSMFSLFQPRSVTNGSNTPIGQESCDNGVYQRLAVLVLDPWDLDAELDSFLEASDH